MAAENKSNLDICLVSIDVECAALGHGHFDLRKPKLDTSSVRVHVHPLRKSC